MELYCPRKCFWRGCFCERPLFFCVDGVVVGVVDGRAGVLIGYPGGKTLMAKLLVQLMPAEIRDYREPFVGGGSTFAQVRQQRPGVQCWINDASPELANLYVQVRDKQPLVWTCVQEMERLANGDVRALYDRAMATLDTASLEEADERPLAAAAYFVASRLSYANNVFMGGFAPKGGRAGKKWTGRENERLLRWHYMAQDVAVSNNDYTRLLEMNGDNVFVFCDPPYRKCTKWLYGRGGLLHKQFDHERFAAAMRACAHMWLITYDDTPETRAAFDGFYVYPFHSQYSTGVSKGKSLPRGKQLLIANYALDEDVLRGWKGKAFVFGG